MIVVGDGDGLSVTHAVEMFALFGGNKRDAGWDGAGRPRADLAVLPHVTHYEMGTSPALAVAVGPFLARPVSPSARR